MLCLDVVGKEFVERISEVEVESMFFFFFFMWLKYIFRMFSACLHVGSVAVDCFDLLLEVLFYVSMVSSVLCSLE